MRDRDRRRARDEQRIRRLAFLYAREEHGVTASVSASGYGGVKITLHRRDGSDAVVSVDARASVIEVETAIDRAMRPAPARVETEASLEMLRMKAEMNVALQNSQLGAQSYNGLLNSAPASSQGSIWSGYPQAFGGLFGRGF